MPQKAQKKIPIRKCVGCGQGKPKKELIRVVKNAAGEISLDDTGRKPGRGAYICPEKACLEKAQKRRGLQHAFSAPVPDEIYASLMRQLEDVNGEEDGAEDG